MKHLLAVAVLCVSASVIAAEKKPAPKTEPKAETKAETKAPESKTLKIEEPDQNDPKNKESETKAKGEMKKDSF